MRNLFGLALIPLLCMGVTILTALVIIFALRRGTKAINAQAQNLKSEHNQATSANTRWARGDLQGEIRPSQKTQPPVTCPACGGENPAGSNTCAFCGGKLS